MRVFHLNVETIILRPLGEVFEFFSRAENLEKLTPPHLSFQILSDLPIEMKAGALIDYRIALMGVPFKWRTEITIWEPPHQFADNQLSGPYRLWLHEHRFEDHPQGTLMTDSLRYAVPGWFLESLVERFFVGPKVREIFAYRQEAILKIFSA
jgi:ligand-binding SRPBCC domain-containing protein